MDILIIGGTQFLGPAFVAEALARGHNLTLFNRGKSQPDFQAAVENIPGDRERDLGRLAGRRWDAVIDTCGYLPRLAGLSAEALRGQVEAYVFISTLSVYPPKGAPKRDESAPVLTLEDPTSEDINGETYGPLKALCERAAQAHFPDRTLVIRAGLIVGPRDPSNRFTYWVTRASKGGPAIAPPAEQPIQFIDARDLAAFTLRLMESRMAGVYNVTGPADRMTIGELLALAIRALNSDTRFQHCGDDFLRKNAIGEFMELPLWVNRELAESFMTFSIDKAIDAGLRFREPAETIRDTWEWARRQPADLPKPANLPAEKEAELLKTLRSDFSRRHLNDESSRAQ